MIGSIWWIHYSLSGSYSVIPTNRRTRRHIERLLMPAAFTAVHRVLVAVSMAALVVTISIAVPTIRPLVKPELAIRVHASRALVKLVPVCRVLVNRVPVNLVLVNRILVIRVPAKWVSTLQVPVAKEASIAVAVSQVLVIYTSSRPAW